jgi:hypothetical protein
VDGPERGSDTPVSVEQHMAELWRGATPAQKLRKMCSIGRLIDDLARAELRQRFPWATDRDLDLRLAGRVLDRETMIAAFGWDPPA